MPSRSEWIVAKTPVESEEGVVCAHHPKAAEAGAAVLARGGNAVDAAVAAGFAVGVAEPFMSGVGGICQLLYRDAATGQVTVFDGTSVLPRRVRANMFPIVDETAKAGMYGWPAVEGDRNNTGWLTPAVPGTPACLLAAHERLGRLPRADVLGPAIELADRGVEVDWYVALSIVAAADRIFPFPATRAIYFRPSGQPLAPESFGSSGDVLRQSDLAETLSRLAEDGPKALYAGELARRIAEQMRENGGLIDEEDLASYRVRVFPDGVSVPYRDVVATFAPEIGGGLTVAETLRILEGFDLGRPGFGTPEAVHLILEAQRRAFRDRFRYLGDPLLVDVPYAALLGPSYAAERRASIDPARATPDAGPGDPWRFANGPTPWPAPERLNPADVDHTTHVSVVDRDRNLVSLTSTLGAMFGSGVVVPGTGILLNNGTTWFDPRPGTQNSIASGRRILWAGSPTILSRNGQPFAALGAPGGRKVISAVLQVILNLVDFGLGIQEAVAAPRAHAEGLESLVDARFGPATIAALRAMGHNLAVREETFASSFFGRPNGVVVDSSSGRLSGGVNQYKPYLAVGL